MPTSIHIRTEPAATGRLGAAYPAADGDVELRVDGAPVDRLTHVLERESAKLLRTERCRRVVFAVPVGDLAAISAAEAAGFRYILDVDIPGKAGGVDELSLLVRDADEEAVALDQAEIPGA